MKRRAFGYDRRCVRGHAELRRGVREAEAHATQPLLPAWCSVQGRAWCSAPQPPAPRSIVGGVRLRAAPCTPPAASRSRFAAQPVSWASLALVALTGGGIVALYNHEKQKRVQGARLLGAQRCVRQARS